MWLIIPLFSDLKSQRLEFRLYRDIEINLLRFSWKWWQIVHLLESIRKKNGLHYLKINVKLQIYNGIKVCCHRPNGDLWHFYLKTYEGDIGGSANYFFFLNSYRKTNNMPPFSGKSEQLYFLPLYNLNINLLPFKPPNVGSLRRIWKIIAFLEFLSQGKWSDIFFDLHDNPMGSFSNHHISKF